VTRDTDFGTISEATDIAIGGRWDEPRWLRCSIAHASIERRPALFRPEYAHPLLRVDGGGKLLKANPERRLGGRRNIIYLTVLVVSDATSEEESTALLPVRLRLALERTSTKDLSTVQVPTVGRSPVQDFPSRDRSRN